MKLIDKIFGKKVEKVYYEKKLVPLSAINAYEKSKEIQDEKERKKIEEDLRKKEEMYSQYIEYLKEIKKAMWEQIEHSIKAGIFSYDFNIKKCGNEEEDRRIRKFIKENLIDDLNKLGYECKLDIIDHRKRSSYTRYIASDLLGECFTQVYNIQICWNKTNEEKIKFIDLDLKRKANNEVEKNTYGGGIRRITSPFSEIDYYDVYHRGNEEVKQIMSQYYCKMFESYYNTKGVLYVL